MAKPEKATVKTAQQATEKIDKSKTEAINEKISKTAAKSLEPDPWVLKTKNK